MALTCVLRTHSAAKANNCDVVDTVDENVTRFEAAMYNSVFFQISECLNDLSDESDESTV